MAAGRQNFSRRSYNRSDEETRSYSSRIGLKSSCNRDIDYRRRGFVDGKLQDKSREVDGFENGSKKRKFSPILWDRDEKQVKKVVTFDVARSYSPKLGKDSERIEKCELQISSVESLVSDVSDDVEVQRSLGTRTPEVHDQETENEDEGYSLEPNLSKSKWAMNDLPVNESDVNNSGLESGEFDPDGVDRNDEVSSLSTEDVQSLGLSSEDDKVANVGANTGYLSSESDSDYEAVLCAGIGMFPSCRNVFEFERLGKISEGTYGVVHKARDSKTGDIVALKKVKTGKERDGFPVTALREINILGMLQHPSLVQMKEVVMDDFNGVYMVMEYVDHELKGYMERMKQPFSQGEVKRLMLQLLECVSYLHDNYVMHRDLKTSNLLLTNDGELKVCDFGMARQYASPLKPYTSLVVTLWYRAPELLLGMKNYSTAVDMWSVGCIMAELLSKKPLFDGSKELEQIDKIFRTLGTPNDSIWPGYSKLPGVKSNFVKQPFNTLKKKFPVATFTGAPVLTELGFDLLNKFLTYDPEKRITAEEALNHGWFREAPLPAEHVRICR